jgi:hypothetical protein
MKGEVLVKKRIIPIAGLFKKQQTGAKGGEIESTNLVEENNSLKLEIKNVTVKKKIP